MIGGSILHNNKTKINKALQAHGGNNEERIFLLKLIQRVSLPLSRTLPGSAIIEVATIVPIFLVVMCELLFLLQYLSIYSDVYMVTYESVKNAEVSGIYLNYKIQKDERIDHAEHLIVDGKNGISLLGTYPSIHEKAMNIRVSYRVQPEIGLIKNKYPIEHNLFVRFWTGYQIEENSEEEHWVYVTQNASVYHTKRTCSYLKISAKQVKRESVLVDACSLCAREEGEGIYVYVTEYGDKYHETLECSSLKRVVYRVSLDEVINLKICSRCSEE